MDKIFIFYSWQSDLPNNTNRGFIEKALLGAVRSIKAVNEPQATTIVIDRDTKDVPGAPNIVETILRKIDRSRIFVCDVSTINGNRKGKYRKTPNPNVMFELGYAFSKLGPNRIILLSNLAYGKENDIPFDFKVHRTLYYDIHNSIDDKTLARTDLQKRLEKAVTSILSGKDELKYKPIEFIISDEEAIFPVIQHLSYHGHFDKQQAERIIKNKTSLYTAQAKLLVEYLIDFEYIISFHSSSIYTLGKEGRSLYNRHTSQSTEGQRRTWISPPGGNEDPSNTLLEQD